MSLPEDIVKRANIDRLLSAANAHRLRGDLLAAEDSCGEALKLDPDNLQIGEMLGDILQALGRLEDARDQYHSLLERNPKLPSVERKFARITLEIDDRSRERHSVEDLMANPHLAADREEARRSTTISILLSVVAPGVGQIYNGEYAKGAIVLGSFVMSLLVIALAGSATFVKQLFNVLTGGGEGGPTYQAWPSPWLLFFLGVGMFSYIYAVVDAPVSAMKREKASGGNKPQAQKNNL